jgi:hypothetical protein
MQDVTTIFDAPKGLSIKEHRARFDFFEAELKKLPQLEDEDYSLVEYKVGDLYARQITIKKDVCLTGRIYKRDHLEIMLSGDIVILSADGGTTRYTGYNVIEAKAGKRQAGFALEDTVWMTINVVPRCVKEDLDFTSVLSYEELNKFVNSVNRADFLKFAEEYGGVDKISDLSSTKDLVELPEGFNNLYVAESNLAGKCLKSRVDINKGEVIGPPSLTGRRTIIGKYCNHALFANTTFSTVDNMQVVIAAKDIPADEEITMNYREVLSYRRSEEVLCQVG